jgi:chromosome segregation protein
MLALETARQKVTKLLVGVEEIDEAVVRGERHYAGKCFAVAYVDLADDVIGRARRLREFQERLLGEDYFHSSGDLRWNNYIYIVAGPKSVEQPDFQLAKAAIEADEDFARKRVVFEDELEAVLGAAKYFTPSKSSQEFDIVGEWSKLLREAKIDGILDRPARTTMLAQIGAGEAGRVATSHKVLSLHASDKELQERWLSKVRVENFRAVHDGKENFNFGQVTLITGPNGTGKTSLLEAIEFFYCGQNRRSISKSAKVYGTLWGSEKQNLAPIDSSRLRARCLHWYNREEKTSTGLLNGFGRYNFLDTDAAFRVTADINPDDLPDDLSRLIVGPDASQIWSYVVKLAPEVQTAADRTYHYLQDAQKNFEALQTKLRELQERPSDAKALSEAFRSSLLQIGFRGMLQTAPFVSADEAKPVQAAYSAIQILLSSGPAFITLESLEERSGAINKVYTTVKLLDTEVKSLNSQVSELESQANNFDIWVKLLERWAVYVRAGYSSVQQAYFQCSELVSGAEAKLGVFANAEVPAIDPKYKSVQLVNALHSAIQGIHETSTQIASLEKMSAAFGQAATVRAQTAQNLKTAVLEVLKGGAPATTCPVCHTVHGEGALKEHIERITSELAQPVELTELSRQLSAARETHKQWLAWKAFLEHLQQIALQLSLPTTQACGEIADALSLARRNLEQAKANMQPVTDALNVLQHSGLSVVEHDNLLSSVIKLSSLTERPYDISVVESQAKDFVNAAVLSREKISSLRMQTEQLLRRIVEEMSPLFDEGWRTRTSTLAGMNAFEHLFDEIYTLEKQRDELLLNFDIGKQVKLSDFEATLAGLLRALNEALQAVAHEKTVSADISQLLANIETQKKHIAELLRRHLNLHSASVALNKMISELSLESATAKSLSAIGLEINDAFARIHSPSEYEYVGSEGVLLRSKANQENWTLDKVSTGQRAAFALSVFLALNRTAAKAPPIILIDDPVAHVDDLNALSFLDYLRDLTVTSRKQVFFATADARVAALFTRKFSFLGDNFKRINLSRESIPN